ncbi:MAG: glycosyltransferase [Chlamydiia bacterium]|nr:glycosyltransferase [Chlamydiia bacterium]
MGPLKAPRSLSVIVPCCKKHLHLLPPLLEELKMQTTLPDEVAISISECSTLPEELKNLSLPFELKVTLTENKQAPGENRNNACRVASGDLFVTQDADDLPHPQRLEILRHFFSETEALHMIHTWLPEPDHASQVDRRQLDEVEKTYKSRYTDFQEIPKEWLWTRGRLLSLHLPHNGNIALRREVFEQVQWPSMRFYEDYHFNRAVIARFRRSLFIDAPLIHYRFQMSSTQIA